MHGPTCKHTRAYTEAHMHACAEIQSRRVTRFLSIVVAICLLHSQVLTTVVSHHAPPASPVHPSVYGSDRGLVYQTNVVLCERRLSDFALTISG